MLHTSAHSFAVNGDRWRLFVGTAFKVPSVKHVRCPEVWCCRISTSELSDKIHSVARSFDRCRIASVSRRDLHPRHPDRHARALFGKTHAGYIILPGLKDWAARKDVSCDITGASKLPELTVWLLEKNAAASRLHRLEILLIKRHGLPGNAGLAKNTHPHTKHRQTGAP